MEEYKCQVCGKLIKEDEGITTLNGWWVCDDDSCRTLNEESQATEKLPPIVSTQNIDKCECIYCHHKFDGETACNSDMYTTTVQCPKCKEWMKVMMSVEYTCYEMDD